MGKVWVRCCDGVSAIVSAVSYAVSVFFLAIVGSTLGAFVGVLIGVNSRKNLFYSMVYGAIAGGTFLTNAFRMSISFWLSDDCSSSNVLQLDFECKDEARRLPNCRHWLHLRCIDKWISLIWQ